MREYGGLTRVSDPTRPTTCDAPCPWSRQSEPSSGSVGERGPQSAPRCGPAGPHGWDWYPSCKAALDYLLALALFAALLPVMLVTMALVKLTSVGPVIYTQKRVGRNGRPFVIYKIRTMAYDCERLTGPTWSSARDPRVTALGRFLRRTHLDELPQLWNVLRGEMSLVGPRPERPEIIAQLERVVPLYRDREGVRPGVTGLAQVQLPPDTDVAGVRRKLACDLYYIRDLGFWLDLRIVLSTALKVVGVPCPWSCRWLGIPTGPVIREYYEGLMASATTGARVPEPEGVGEPRPGWLPSSDAERAPSSDAERAPSSDAERALAWGD
jgi:lipopolysaccharide/colanic/teichoic acid biosynthesis glycosyltransferase